MQIFTVHFHLDFIPSIEPARFVEVFFMVQIETEQSRVILGRAAGQVEIRMHSVESIVLHIRYLKRFPTKLDQIPQTFRNGSFVVILASVGCYQGRGQRILAGRIDRFQ